MPNQLSSARKSTKVEKPTRMQVAFHEAAHAVVAFYSDLLILNASISAAHPDRKGLVTYTHKFRESHRRVAAHMRKHRDSRRRVADRKVRGDLFVEARVSFAGPVAEYWCCKSARNMVTFPQLSECEELGSALDFDAAFDAAFAAEWETAKRMMFIDDALASAQMFVALYWDDVLKVAKALAERGRLTGLQIVDIICDVPTKSRRRSKASFERG